MTATKLWSDKEIREIKALAQTEMEKGFPSEDSISNLLKIKTDLLQELKDCNASAPDERRRWTEHDMDIHHEIICRSVLGGGWGIRQHVAKLIKMIDQLQYERWTE